MTVLATSKFNRPSDQAHSQWRLNYGNGMKAVSRNMEGQDDNDMVLDINRTDFTVSNNNIF